MFSRQVSPEDAVFLLDAKNAAELDQAVASGAVKAKKGPEVEKFLVADLVMFKLAQTIQELGVEPEKAEELVKALVEKFGLEVEEAIQVVNTMPESIEEIRVFLAGGRKIVEASKLQEILNLLNEYRKKE